MIDYRLKSKRIIKWYEYNMQYPEDENSKQDTEETSEDVAQTLPEDIPDAAEVQETLNTMIDEEEEIDLATTGLDESDQALVADIMARFKEAKQNTVDGLFSNASDMAEMSTDNDESSNTSFDDTPMSEEDLIAAICAPKQDNVDALIGEAQSDM